MKGKKKKMIQMNYGDLKKSNKKLGKLLQENKVDFQYDSETEEYVAILDVIKQKKQSKRSVSPRISTKKYAKSSKSVQKSPSRSKRSMKQTVSKSIRKSQTSRRAKSLFNIKTYKIINEDKHEILKQFIPFFPKIDFENIKTAPILISRKFLMRKLELFYNKQFESILRVKSTTALGLADTIYEFYKPKYNESKTYLVQTIANIVYSVYKYRHIREINLFYEFLTQKQDDFSFLFYLYIRQNFKFITFNYFLSHKISEKDPKDLYIDKEKAYEIILSAMYFSNDATKAIRKELIRKTKQRKNVNYYEFLLICFETELDYSNMDLMARSLALYNFKNNHDPYTVQKETRIDADLAYHYHKPLVKKMVYEDQIQRARQISKKARLNMGEKSFDELLTEVNKDSQTLKTNQYRYTEDFSNTGNQDIDKLNNMINTYDVEDMDNVFKEGLDDRKVQTKSVGFVMNNQESKAKNNTLETNRHGSIGSQIEEAIKERYRSKYDSESQELNSIIKESLKHLLQIFIDEFCETFGVQDPNLEVVKQSCFEMFYSKILKIMSMLFVDNKNKFFELLRVDPLTNKRAFLFWQNMTEIYDSFRVNSDKLTENEINEFVKDFIDFNHIRDKLVFLLRYQFNLKEEVKEIMKQNDSQYNTEENERLYQTRRESEFFGNGRRKSSNFNVDSKDRSPTFAESLNN